MPTKLIKQFLLGIFCLCALVYSFIGEPVAAFVTGPPASHTGAPALLTFPVEPTCTRSLSGRGKVDVCLTVDNKRANAVTINIK